MTRLEMLLEFLKQSPHDPFARYGLALEYKNLGQREQAAAVFRDLIAEHPDYTAAYLHAGNTLAELGRRDEAKVVYQAGIAVCGKKGDAHAKNELEAALMNL